MYILRLPIAIKPAVTAPKKSLHANTSFPSSPQLNSIENNVAIAKSFSPGTHFRVMLIIYD